MPTITVALGERSYPIWVRHDRYHALGRLLRSLGLGPVGVVITNRTTRQHAGRAVLRALAAAGWCAHVIEVPDTERAKSPAVVLRVVRELARVTRRETPTLFALGGGVVGDLTGFVAGTFRRGVPYVQLPTTLLAQVDSAIGGKVGVDLPEGKNLLGAFHQPCAVYSEISVLSTLPTRQWRSGLAEIIKYAAIGDLTLWQRLERRCSAILRRQASDTIWMISRCARIKARIVSRDERETRGIRTLLNFGHTVGHALEAATHYGSRFTHGEAIAVGMAAAADLGAALGITSDGTRQRLLRLLQAYGLPTTAPGVSAARVERAMAFDKKFLAGAQRWVLVRRLGHATVVRGVNPRLVHHIVRQRLGAHD